jgi:anaerobic C4-dicarboxylate transporter
MITLMPIGVALGLSGGSLIAMFPAVNGYFFLPTYGTLLAAIAFDQTGTTKIGRVRAQPQLHDPGVGSHDLGHRHRFPAGAGRRLVQ